MKKILLLILISLILSPTISRAAGDKYTLLEPLPCIQGVGDCKVGTMQEEISLDSYIGYVFKFAIALAAFLAVIMIIWGGFEYMTSEIPSLKLEGKGRISNAIIGLLMVLASYLILATIDPRLVAINTKIDPIVIKKSDLDEVGKFRTNLEKDLAALSNEDRNKVAELEKEIVPMKKKLEDLENLIKYGEATEEEIKMYNSVLADLKGTEIQQTQIIAHASARKQLDNVFKTLHNSESFPVGNGELGPGASTLMLSSKESINNIYKKYLDDPNIKSDPLARQKMEVANKFYIDQINEEQRLMSIVNRTIGSDKGKITTLRAELTKTSENLLNFERNTNLSADMQKVNSDSELSKQYLTLLKDRRTIITKTLSDLEVKK